MSETEVPSSWFYAAYEGQPPWDIDRPQPALVALADAVRGSVLDVGCGTGEHALFYAARGREAWGVDMVPAAIEKARAKAKARGIAATFVVGDALRLGALGRRFDWAIDSGLFHVFSDADRARYLTSLASVIDPGGGVHLLCFSELTPGTEGPRRVTQPEIRAAFARGWSVRSIDAVEFGVRFERPAPRGRRAVIARTE